MQPFWRPETLWLTGVALALVALLVWLRPAERATYLNTLLFFALGLAGELVADALERAALPRAAIVVYTIFSIIVALAVIRLCGLAIFRLLLPPLRLRAPRIAEELAVAAGYAGYAVVQLGAAGLDLTGIVATSAVITAVLAFSMQDTLGNVLGGVALQLDNSIRVGDWVKFDETVGKVTDIRWRSTLIETRNWETVVVPNSLLMKSKVTILGQRQNEPMQWRRWVSFTVDPGDPPARVIATAESAIQEADIPNVARVPTPNCLLMGFEQGNLRYSLRYWLTDLLHDDGTDSAVRVHLFAAFQRVGIHVAEPQQTVHLYEEDETEHEAARKSEVRRRLYAIRGVDLFAGLHPEERRTVVERLQRVPFARGDVITRQGNASHWLYILASGEAEVVLESPDAPRRTLGAIQSGGFFGEMGLMTGEPRAATVIAKGDVECYRLDKASFRDLLVSRPQIAEEISAVMASRRSDLEQLRETVAQEAQRSPATQSELLARIRQFFGLS